MDEMDRPSGPPLGAATQSTGRPLAENGISRLPPLNTVRRMPQDTIRHAPSSSSMNSQSLNSIPAAGQVVQLARDAMKSALEENRTKAAEATGVSNELKQGITIDLSHKQIKVFPDEVVDIIKNELERLAVSHNQISTFPSRFSECTSLRYLNVRNNQIREFPQAICQLTSLEILDLGRNKLKVLPPELVKLSSLKVLSVPRNRIEALPLCLADMASLQVLKLDGNPITFPPKEVLQQPQTPSPPNAGFQESEIASQIKRFLKQEAMAHRSETESGGEESSEGTETPRPVKRVMSGRFPIKVNGAEVPDVRSPALPRAPPIPSRSHYRGLSQQNAALRRPGVLPLTIGSNNERVRSNSEGLVQPPRSSDRSRRMGIVSKKASELGTVDETKLNRYSHYRGLSHGSALLAGTNGTTASTNSRSPASPADSASQRATYVRRLSSLPERKRESNSPDSVIEGAKGILYALFQVHPLIQNLLGLARDGTNKRTSLERVFYNATTHVEELDRHVQSYISYSDEDEETSPRSNENVHSACLTSVHAYIHVLGLLSMNVETLLANGDPRYIRTLLLLIYGSAAEVRNAGADLFRHGRSIKPRIPIPIPETINETVRYQPRDKSATPTRDRPGTISRSRSGTVLQQSNTLRVATDNPPPPFHPGALRSATMTSATPRSGDSFASNTSSGRLAPGDFSEEDRLFEKIFLLLQQSSEMAIKILPLVSSHFITAMRTNNQQPSPDTTRQFWQVLVQRCEMAQQTADVLKTRLSQIKLKEPGIRTQGAFWELCSAFVHAYTDLVVKVKEAKSISTLLPPEVIVLLRPLQKVIKNTSQLIQSSPWSFLAGPQTSNGVNGSYTTQSPASQIPLPMTPQSAALGPAVQATVPSTPQSASYDQIFNGNVFERAGTYLANMSSSSVASSRSGTMSSALGSNDGMMTPASILSPMNSMSSMSSSRYNGNGNGKMAF
ncbi:Leucine-rich repeat-containing protein sog2 [Lachnellula arida]|uniref:Leucine-rich repeat-containing protein sog2 n=1 Tax=Lachnellula arida TaxID=1316785 RepID=A0A8T9BFY7_9HELO|nr:Leucine-rich repeat-containing protein sog2 [Lachnellula arida]